jgi:hypothetical protein
MDLASPASRGGQWQFCGYFWEVHGHFGKVWPTPADGAGGSYVFWLCPPGFAPESANRGGFSGGAVFLTPLVGLQQKTATDPELKPNQTDPMITSYDDYDRRQLSASSSIHPSIHAAAAMSTPCRSGRDDVRHRAPPDKKKGQP